MKKVELYADNLGRLIVHPWKLSQRRGSRDMKKVELYADNLGRLIVHPWKLSQRRGSRGPKTLFKYIAFYWTVWWTSLAGIFSFVM